MYLFGRTPTVYSTHHFPYGPIAFLFSFSFNVQMSTEITSSHHSITDSTANPHHYHQYLLHLPLFHFNCQSFSPSTHPSLSPSVCISTGNLSSHLFIFMYYISTFSYSISSLLCFAGQPGWWWRLVEVGEVERGVSHLGGEGWERKWGRVTVG